MKKISLMFAVAVAALGFSSCSETWDDNPVMKTDEKVRHADFLNNPVMGEQSIMLTESESTGFFHLTCSQPDFGYAAAAVYKVQCSLTEDFAVMEEIAEEFTNCSAIDPRNGDVAKAIEKLSGVVGEDQLPLPYQTLYMRLRAYVPQAEAQTEFISNVVSFKEVSADYLAIWVANIPQGIYLRGGMNNWGNAAGDLDGWEFVSGPDDYTYVTETIDIPDGIEFKVADDAWKKINLGSGDDGGDVFPGKTIKLADNGGNLLMKGAFHGYALLSLKNGQYTLLMVEVAD